jgi:transmembrane 9 superfamily protein 2/4
MPYKVNAVPTKIGNKPWYLKLKYITWFTGLIPFITIFIEFIYIIEAMWRHQVYFVASFLGFSFISLSITSMEISIIFIYLNLCKGDYNWIWKSFFVSASPAMYIAAYSVYYFFDLNITRFTASVANFCLMGFITCVIGLVCGTVGVCMTYVFVYFMHSKIKID